MSADAVSGQQQRSVLAPVIASTISPKSKLHITPWPQAASSESFENRHVRPSTTRPYSQVNTQPQAIRGHKRRVTGEIKMAEHENQAQRRYNGPSAHSRTASLDSTGNKIAELSAQLRARLSYAASKVERSRQLLQQGESALHQANMSTINGSVDPSHGREPPQSASSQTPKLAPPVDIVPGDRTKFVRRRPNPNENGHSTSQHTTSGHRRHRSELDGKTALNTASRWTGISNVSPFTPSQSGPNSRALTPLLTSNRSPMKRRTPSQNALMEKDAIETLLFMSSPENSGYQSGSRPRKSSVSVSIEAQMAASKHTSSQESNNSRGKHLGTSNFFEHEALRTSLPASITGNPTIGLEAQAGDEIDRLLDQMEGDGRSDTDLIAYSFDFGASQHPGSYEFSGGNR